MLRHLVLCQFKAEITPEHRQAVAEAFAELPRKIPLIADFEWGTDVSVENLQQGLTHGFVVTFRSAADRDAYLPHPEHQKFVQFATPCLEKVVVFDYWVQS